jgi:hypothetical protein
MSTKVTEHLFTGSTTPYTSYDSTKTNLGKWIQQKSGLGIYDNFAGPFPLTHARPMEQSTAYQHNVIYVYDLSSTISWIFLGEGGAAAATRRITLYRFNKTTQDLSWRGFITLTYPTATHVVKGLAVARHCYTTGTVSVSGTAVTGSGTAWTTARYAVGGRIGFGSTDPTQITTWYHISAIGSNTSITLIENAGTIGSGTFVIEELRIYTANTNTTLTNGGLFVAKGVSYDDFATGGTTIAAAVSTDNQKAVYWLSDAATVLNTVACGIAIDSTQSDTSHFIWVLNADAGTTARIYKYDARVALAGLSAGQSSSAFVFRTGTAATTGTIASVNGQNGIIVTASHGPGSGAKSMYWVTTTRIYRSLETSITNAGTGFLTDSLAETPTGGTNTFAASNLMHQIFYDSVIDRFIVLSNTVLFRQYVTAYSSSTTNKLDHVFLINTNQVDSSLSWANRPKIPSMISNPFLGASSDGIIYLSRIGTGSTTSGLYIFPLSAHWDYASGSSSDNQQRLITPSIDTTGCQKFYRVYTNHVEYTGSQTSTAKSLLPNPNKVPVVLENPHIKDSVLGLQNEPFKKYYRTSGISDDSGGWTAIDDTGDLTAATPSSEIQFMFEFKTIGNICLMSKIFGVFVVFEDDETDSHYEPSVNKSNINSKIFAWRFSKAFGSTVPELIVRIHDITGSVVAADRTTISAYGTFEKSTDGTNWVAYNTTDKGNETTFVRYTVSGTINNIKTRAILQQYVAQSTGSGTPTGSLTKDIVFTSKNYLLETDVGSAQPLLNILTNSSNQDALINELKQQPIPISNRRKVR